MLLVVSPAKSMDFVTPWATREHSVPDFMREAGRLVRLLRGYGVADLTALMGLSAGLGALNHARFGAWHAPFTPDNARPALLAFTGEVYRGIDAGTFAAEDFRFAQRHLRILSGLYGVLRPLDLIQAYRLEMGTGLVNERGDDLYAFWGTRIARALNEHARAVRAHHLVNLASREYFHAVRRDSLDLEVVTPVFKDRQGGGYRVVGVLAKRARGMMARFVVQKRLRRPEQLRDFDLGGYAFNSGLSSAAEFVFTRDARAA